MGQYQNIVSKDIWWMRCLVWGKLSWTMVVSCRWSTSPKQQSLWGSPPNTPHPPPPFWLASPLEVCRVQRTLVFEAHSPTFHSSASALIWWHHHNYLWRPLRTHDVLGPFKQRTARFRDFYNKRIQRGLKIWLNCYKESKQRKCTFNYICCVNAENLLYMVRRDLNSEIRHFEIISLSWNCE